MNLSPRRKALKKEIFKESYFEFFKYFWSEVSSETLIENWHIKLLCDLLGEVGHKIAIMYEGDVREDVLEDIIINVPPGTSKSSICTILFPVWLWTLDPTIQIISGSFSGSLSVKHGTDSRTIIRSPKFQELYSDSFQMRKDQDQKTFYQNTAGGFRIMTSSGASVIGKHAHIHLPDDPVDPKGAKSEKVLKTVNEWINKTLSTRKVRKVGCPTIMVMQRLAEDDPTGNWLEKKEKEGKKLRHIRLPATDNYEVHPKEMEVTFNGETKTIEKWYSDNDGYLDPVRMNQKALDKLKIELGETDYAGQMGQNPMPLEGNIYKKKYFRIINSSELTGTNIYQMPRFFTVDTASKKGEENDYSVFSCFTKIDKYLVLLHSIRGKWDINELPVKLKEYVAQHQLSEYDRVYIEDKSSGTQLIQILKVTTKLNLWEFNPNSDKVYRANIAVAALGGNQCFVVNDGTWNHTGYLNELYKFPNAKNDDQADTFSMGCLVGFYKGDTGGYSVVKVS